MTNIHFAGSLVHGLYEQEGLSIEADSRARTLMKMNRASFLMHALSGQKGLRSEADSGAQHKRGGALWEWLVDLTCEVHT